MKIYLDNVFLLNFSFDYLLLLSVAILLRRNVPMKRIILGAFIGGLSIFILFLKINSIQLFFIKLLISILMVLATFRYRNIKYTSKNLLYLYSASMILGGFLYFLNTEFSYKQDGLVFYHNGLSINFLFLIIFSPIIIYLYIRQGLELKNRYANYYKIDVHLNDKTYKLNGFLDTGNNLIDPVSKKPVVVIDEGIIKGHFNYIYVPYQTITEEGLLKCIPATIYIEKIKKEKEVLLGFMKQKNIEGIDCIMNPILVEE